MRWLLERSAEQKVNIKTTEAPHYRRVAIQQEAGQVRNVGHGVRSGFGIRDGSGIMFISHLGEVFPAGFLPLKAGNIRSANVVDIYRDSQIFTDLRDSSKLKGKCGRCEFSHVCGGSRARAFSHTGDMLESDPLCLYEPKQVGHGHLAMAG
ncbi:MAG TPA: SPASM domain-containing protein [Chthonomonadaceae bacterium]|nr:SPASM domain-containing protein [Chthonomonadaceae bacterium]